MRRKKKMNIQELAQSIADERKFRDYEADRFDKIVWPTGKSDTFPISPQDIMKLYPHLTDGTLLPKHPGHFVFRRPVKTLLEQGMHVPKILDRCSLVAILDALKIICPYEVLQPWLAAYAKKIQTPHAPESRLHRDLISYFDPAKKKEPWDGDMAAVLESIKTQPEIPLGLMMLHAGVATYAIQLGAAIEGETKIDPLECTRAKKFCVFLEEAFFNNRAVANMPLVFSAYALSHPSQATMRVPAKEEILVPAVASSFQGGLFREKFHDHVTGEDSIVVCSGGPLLRTLYAGGVLGTYIKLARDLIERDPRWRDVAGKAVALVEGSRTYINQAVIEAIAPTAPRAPIGCPFHARAMAAQKAALGS